MNNNILTNLKYCPLCSHRLKTVDLNGARRLRCVKCRWINYENPLPSVTAVVKRHNSILLIKRGVAPHKGRWSLPSGFIEIEESPEEACLRELEEEAGLKGKILDLIGVYTQKSTIYKMVLVVAYGVEAENKNPVPGDDADDAKFFPVDNLPDIPFESHRRVIEDFKNVSNN